MRICDRCGKVTKYACLLEREFEELEVCQECHEQLIARIVKQFDWLNRVRARRRARVFQEWKREGEMCKEKTIQVLAIREPRRRSFLSWLRPGG